MVVEVEVVGVVVEVEVVGVVDAVVVVLVVVLVEVVVEVVVAVASVASRLRGTGKNHFFRVIKLFRSTRSTHPCCPLL